MLRYNDREKSQSNNKKFFDDRKEQMPSTDTLLKSMNIQD